MRWIRYADRAGARWGVLNDEDAVLPLATGRDGEAHLEAVLRGQATAPEMDRGALVPLEGLRLLPPLLPEATLYCVGLNYKSHVDETGRDLPPQPAIFIRTPASVVGANEALEHPGVSAQFDFEGEVAVVIGEGGRGIRREDALRHVAGYTCFNDASVRDYQQQSVSAGKNFHRSGSCGPWIVAASAMPADAELTVQTRLNGELVQSSHLGLLIYPVDQIVSYLSQFAQLRTGDLIATGTPAGVGARRTPPLWMKAGDEVEVTVGGVGVLRNPVRARAAVAGD